MATWLHARPAHCITPGGDLGEGGLVIWLRRVVSLGKMTMDEHRDGR